MSLQLAAQHLASRGRGPDTTLVHMAPQEVAGLQAIAKAHGGSLTLNPDTGLPEAGFLSRILPMLAGAALAATGIGAPMAALMVGGGSAAATGSLKKGLMAGLGAFGGAGLAGGLMSAGAAGASGAAGTGLSALDAGMGVMPTGAIGAAEAFAPSALDAGIGAMPTGNIGANALDAGMNAYPNANLAAAPIASPVNPIQPLPAPVQTVTQAPTFSDNISQMGRGIQNLGTSEGRELFMGNAASKGVEAKGVGGTKGLLQSGLAGFAPVMEEAMTPKPMTPRPVESPQNFAFDYGRRENPQAGYTGASTGEYTYFDPRFTRVAAGGGLMDIGPIEAMSNRNQAETLMANGGQMFASGGISHLGDYSDGGRLLKGPGDGVSDSIPATIADKRPARLADGEFVVPARIVSELGNGSTEAGARKLYAMMDRVQNARKKSIGKDRVAVNSRSEKLLPA